jgi:hypothetical protein
MGLPTPAQIQRHQAFIQEHLLTLGTLAWAGYQVYGRGAVIVHEADQTIRYQGGGRRAFFGKRWQREARWVTRYDSEQLMMIVMNTLEGDHASYLMGLPMTGAALGQAVQEARLAEDSRAMMAQLLGQSGT